MKLLTPNSTLRKSPQWAACCLGLLLLMCAGGAAQAGAVPPATSNLASTADRMVSYRHQEHMWITEDTHTQLIYNRGDGLQLAGSKDGVTWSSKFSFAETDYSSTSDSVYKNGVLTVVYSSSAHDIRLQSLRYDPDFRSWLPLGPFETVRRSAEGVISSNPTLVEDALGNVWVAFLEQRAIVNPPNSGEVSSQLRLFARAAGSASWQNTAITFGPKDVTPLEKPKRSARLVRTPVGLGVIYAIGDNIFWATRNTGSELTLKWVDDQTKPLVKGTDGQVDSDPYASHFSLATDGDGFMHLVYTDGGIAYYRRYNPQPDVLAWGSNPLPLSKAVQAGYPQVTWLGGKKIAVVFDVHPAPDLATPDEQKPSKLLVLQSASRGAKESFVCTSYLTHPAPTSVKLSDGSVSDGIAYKHMRSEVPSVAPATGVPVVMQYEIVQDGVVVGYQAYAYRFSASSTKGCDS